MIRPTREMPPRDEPTVESELMNFAESPTAESPALKPADVRGRICVEAAIPNKADQTAEVSIDDLGLDLDHLEEIRRRSVSNRGSRRPIIRPMRRPWSRASMRRSRRMMAEAESRARDRDLTELERELEASFVADLGSDHEEIKTAVLGPESAPTVQMPRSTDAIGTRQPRASNRPNIPTSRNRTRSTWIPPRSCAASTPTASTWIWTGWPMPWGPATPSSSRARKTKCFRPRFSKPVSATAASTWTWAKR